MERGGYSLPKLRNKLNQDPQNAMLQAQYLEMLFASNELQFAHKFLSSKDLSESPEVLYWSGRVLQQLGFVAQALDKYQRCLRCSGLHEGALLHMAHLYAEFNQYEQSLKTFRKYQTLKPTAWDAFFEFAKVMARFGEYEAAAELCWDIYQACPDRQDALLFWVEAYLLTQPDLVLLFLIETAIQEPSLRTEMAIRASSILASQGQVSEMQQCLEMALQDPALEDALAYRLLRVLSFEFISESSEAIDKYAQYSFKALENIVGVLQNQPKSAALIHDDFSNLQAYLQVWKYLAYQVYLNLDIKPYRELFGKLFYRMLPDLEQVCPSRPGNPEKMVRSHKPHLVFVINSNSAVQAFISGVLKHWPRESWQVSLLYLSPAKLYDTLFADCPEFEHVIMPEDPLLVLQRIRGLKPDLLFFTEVHTEKLFQSFLASYRLAPVQVTSWLSSGTTGLANMDYYLSSRLLEQAHNPQRFYSEQLILLNEIPAYFSAPAISTQRYPRSDYGLPEHARVYLCPHLMFKMHPDFDLILAEILRSDPEAQVVLLARPDNVRYRTQLIQRLEQQMPDFMPRIWFLPKMSYPDFLSLLLLADVVLDPFYFGGGTSSFEALALGVPIVTWPGEHLHGRITGAYYQKMKLNDCIASGPSDYVKTALKLATDPVWNQQIRQAISERSSLIFDNLSAVHEMSNCLFALIKAHYESK